MKFAGSSMTGSVAKEWQDKVMHAALKVGNQSLLGTDAPPDRFQPPQGFFVSISAKTPEKADRVFNELAAGGKIHMPIQKTFWSARFGMTADRFGIPWIVNCEQP